MGIKFKMLLVFSTLTVILVFFQNCGEMDSLVSEIDSANYDETITRPTDSEIESIDDSIDEDMILFSKSSSAAIKGNLERVSEIGNNIYITGWACQTGHRASINVHLYVGGAAGKGSFVMSTPANRSNEVGVNTACGTSGSSHRFMFIVHKSKLDIHRTKTIYVHGIAATAGLVNLKIHNSGNLRVPNFSYMAWHSNNPQQLRMHAFGPSILAEDGKSIFDATFDQHGNPSIVYSSFWENLREKFQAIKLNFLFFDNIGIIQESPVGTSLNDEQLKGLRALTSNYGLKLVVSAGAGLAFDCTDRPPWKVAQDAVDAEMKVFSRLKVKLGSAEALRTGIGVRNRIIGVHEINIDGPFLRLITGSRKAFSCHQKGQGFSSVETAEIVARYISKLQRALYYQQGFHPKINIVFNLPNWEIGGEDEVSWGTLTQDLKLEDMLQDFKDQNRFYGNINSLVLDYPYNYIAGYKRGNEIFKNRIVALNNIGKTLRGAPDISFMVNDTMSVEDLLMKAVSENNRDDMKALSCMYLGNTRPYLLFYYFNSCTAMPESFTRANQYRGFTNLLTAEMAKPVNQRDPVKIAAITVMQDHGWPGSEERFTIFDQITTKNNSIYKGHVRQYYNMVKRGLPAGVAVDTIYMQSWQNMPRNMKEYGTHLTTYVDW